MKTPKKTDGFQREPDPMRDLNIDIGSRDDDEDIIDLEDIIEMPDRPIDEDEDLDLDDAIFDADADLQPEPQKPAPTAAPPPPIKEQTLVPASQEEDLDKLLGDQTEEDEMLFDSASSGGPQKAPVERAQPQVFDEDERSFWDELIDKPGSPKTRISAEEKADLSEEAVAAAKADSARAPVPAGLSQTAEELIDRIESRLQAHIRTTMESMLPDLVRSIIHEEVEKLKKELQRAD